MVNLVISEEQFNGEQGVDIFLDYVRLLSATENTNPFELIEVLENDDGDIMLVLDFHGYDVLVNSLMYKAYSNDIGAFSFPNGVLTYSLMDREKGVYFYFGSFVRGDADGYESGYCDGVLDTCDCPPGRCPFSVEQEESWIRSFSDNEYLFPKTQKPTVTENGLGGKPTVFTVWSVKLTVH